MRIDKLVVCLLTLCLASCASEKKLSDSRAGLVLIYVVESTFLIDVNLDGTSSSKQARNISQESKDFCNALVVTLERNGIAASLVKKDKQWQMWVPRQEKVVAEQLLDELTKELMPNTIRLSPTRVDNE